MSDTDRIRMSYIQEATFGVMVAGALKDVRLTGESLKQSSSFVESTEIRSDRQVVDVIRTTAAAEGDINVEMSYGAHDDLIMANLFSAGWSSPVTVGPIATISAAAGDNSFNDSANGLAGLLVNQWVRTTGFTNAANNGIFKVTSSAAGKIIVSGGTLVTEAASAGRTIVMGEQIVNGTTQASFSFERKNTDLTNIFTQYLGMTPSGMKFSVKSDQIITGSFSFMGKKEVKSTATGGTSYVTAPTNEVMAGVDDIYAIVEAGAVISQVEMFDFDLTNNLRQRKQIGTLGPISIGAGKVGCTGSLQMYFSDQSIMDKYRNNTETSLAIVAKDSLGNAYAIEWPRVKLTEGQASAGGQNQDIMANMKFMAKRHATEGITMRITRFAAP